MCTQCGTMRWCVVAAVAALAVHAAAVDTLFDSCGVEFVALEWDGLRPDPSDVNGQSYRGDFVLREDLNVGGYTLRRVALDTLGQNVTVATSESTPYRQESVSWDIGTQTDVVKWAFEAMRVSVTPDAAVNSVGMAPTGQLASRWNSVVYATNPAGGWFISEPNDFDPLGIVDGGMPDRLLCAPVPGSLPDTACGVAGTLDGAPVTVVLVPEMVWVLLSPADFAAVAADTVTVGVGTAAFDISASEVVGGSVHRLSPHSAVADGVVVLGTGGIGAVVEVGRDGWVRVAPTESAHFMYSDSALDAAVVITLVITGISWTVMPTSRLHPPPPRPGDTSVLTRGRSWQVILGAIVVGVAFATAVAEMAQWRVAAKSVLWLECHMAAAGTQFGVYVMLGIIVAASVLFCATAWPVWTRDTTPLAQLSMRTAVTIAGTCGLMLATLRATGVEYSKRPSLVFVTFPVAFLSIMSRSADSSVSASGHASFAPLSNAAAATLVYALSAVFVLAMGVFVVQPTLVVLTVPYVPDTWQQVVLVCLFLLKAVWVGHSNSALLTGSEKQA